MKRVFAWIFLVLCGMTAVAFTLGPRSEPGVVELVWATDDNPGRRGVIELFNRLHPGVRVRVDPDNTGMAKVIVQSLAGVGPDLFDSYGPTVLDAYVRSGVALECDAELRARGVDPGRVWPSSLQSCLLGGRLYGHPYNVGTRAIWYHKDLFDAAGVPYPKAGWTWADLVEAGRRLTRYDERGRPVQFGLIGDWDTMNALVQWDAPFYTAEGTRCVLDLPQAGEAMQFMQDLIYEHHVMPSPTEETAMTTVGGYASGTLTLFGSRKGAMAFAGRWWMSVFSDESYRDLRLGFAEAPRGPKDVLLGGAKGILVNARGRHLREALDFVAFLHRREFTELIDRQGDGLGPVMGYVQADPVLRLPSPPMEDDSRVWCEAMAKAVPLPHSPYLNGAVAERIMFRQTGLVYSRVKNGRDAMRDAAREMNAALLEGLAADPALRRRYLEAVAAGARPAWEPGQAPEWAR